MKTCMRIKHVSNTIPAQYLSMYYYCSLGKMKKVKIGLIFFFATVDWSDLNSSAGQWGSMLQQHPHVYVNCLWGESPEACWFEAPLCINTQCSSWVDPSCQSAPREPLVVTRTQRRQLCCDKAAVSSRKKKQEKTLIFLFWTFPFH